MPARNLPVGFALRRPPQHFEEALQAYTRRCPCCVPRCGAPAEPHHVNRRSDDSSVVPLCRPHHDEYHGIARAAFEARYKFDLRDAIIDNLQGYLRGDDYPAF